MFVRVRPRQASISPSELKHFFLEKVIPVFVRVSGFGIHVFVRVRPRQASISPGSELKHFFLEKVIPVFVRVSAPPRIFK